MKQLSRIAAAAALAAGALIATGASASVICTSCSYTGPIAGPGNLFVGTMNSTTFDATFMDSGSTFASAGTSVAFSHVYLFGFTPIGSVTSSMNFIPGANFTNFNIQLMNVTSSTCGATNTVCTGVTLGSVIANSTNANASSLIGFQAVPAGTYAIRVNANWTGAAGTLYSGQISTVPVTEPGSLALAGLALVGAATVTRRRKA